MTAEPWLDDQVVRLSRLILALHRGAQVQPAAGFQDWALKALALELPFDSALWGAGHVRPDGTPNAHALHLYRQPAQLMVDYATIAQHDPVFAESSHRRGVTVAAATRAVVPPLAHWYLDRYRIEHALSTIDVDPLTALLNDIALWRSDPTQPFSEDERRFMQAIFPHLIEAHTQNQLVHLVAASGPRLAGPWRAAAADRSGLLHHAHNEFAGLVRQEVEGWTGPYLPDTLRSALGDWHAHRIVGQQVVWKLVPMGELCLVQVRQAEPIDWLSPREREVAAYAAQGLSHKDIARVLDLAPATVRNHLASACRRVKVNSTAQIAAMVQRAE